MNIESLNLPPSSLIICSRNRAQLLHETVESVLQGDELPTELLIIDQSDNRNAILSDLKNERGCQIRYVWSHSRGVSRARNEGMRVASYDILALIDDDMRVAQNWYGTLVRALVSVESTAVVTGRVLPGQVEKPGGFVPALVESNMPKIYRGRIGTDILASCHMAMYRGAFENVGGFDERLGPGTSYPGADDNDYGFRLLEAGFKIIYVPDAVIYHRAWRGTRDYLPLRWNYGRGKGGYYLKHIHFNDWHMFVRMMGDMALRLIRFPWRFLHRPQLALGDLAYVVGIISGAMEWTLTQRKNRAADFYGRA